jgi:hypothetical protein
MKLFQQMLVAGASLSLLAPLAAQADINVEGIKDYSNKSSKKFNSQTFADELAALDESVENLEAKMNAFEAGSFSDTTTMDTKVVFTVGGTDHALTQADETDNVRFAYTLQTNLNSSFTGDDNLYISLKTGNHTGKFVNKDYGTYLSAGNSNGDALKVDKLWYQFPLGDRNTVWVGPKIENYYMHGTSPSIYQPVTKQFTLGGNGEAYGASTSQGAGWAFKTDNGFAVSSNVVSKSDSSIKNAAETAYINTGLLGERTKTSWATQVGITKPKYSASVIVNQKYNGWTDGYFESKQHAPAATDGNLTAIGLRGWWRPADTGSGTPSISLGYDTTSYSGAAASDDNSTAWFAGLTWEDSFAADDKIGIAFGQPTTNEDETVDPFAYEAYYQFQVNDSVTMTPTIFGGSDRNGAAGGDVFGALVNTTFKF